MTFSSQSATRQQTKFLEEDAKKRDKQHKRSIKQGRIIIAITLLALIVSVIALLIAL